MPGCCSPLRGSWPTPPLTRSRFPAVRATWGGPLSSLPCLGMLGRLILLLMDMLLGQRAAAEVNGGGQGAMTALRPHEGLSRGESWAHTCSPSQWRAALLGSKPPAGGGRAPGREGPATQVLRLAECAQTRPDRWLKARERLSIYFASVTSWFVKARDYYTYEVAADALMAVGTHCKSLAHHICLRQLAQRGYRGACGTHPWTSRQPQRAFATRSAEVMAR